MLIQGRMSKGSNMILDLILGNQTEVVQGNLVDKWVMKDNLVGKGIVEVICRMFSVLNVRSLDIINPIVGLKAGSWIRGQFLQVIKLQVSMIACLWCIVKRLLEILQFGC